MLRENDDTLAAVRYILDNPVRAGLVERPLDYPHSGSAIYPREALVEAFDRDTLRDCVRPAEAGRYE